MVPIAHANDGGGSTRIPAACCGLVGLKPQRGRISLAPDAGQAFLVQDGVLTRTVGETAAVLDVLAGYEIGDATWAPEPLEDYATAAASDPGKLRIALALNSPLGETAPVSAADQQAVRDAATLLESLGHEVVEADAPWDKPGLMETFTASFGPAVATQILLASMLAGREPQEDDMEALSWLVWNISSSITSTQALAAEMQLHAVGREYNTWAHAYDMVLCPSLAEAPVTIGTIDPQGADPVATFARAGQFTPFTAVANVVGNPAISLPLAERPADDENAGLPLGVQLVGRPAGEDQLLAVGAQLEAAQPWSDRRAPVGSAAA
jgi:amidase